MQISLLFYNRGMFNERVESGGVFLHVSLFLGIVDSFSVSGNGGLEGITSWF